DGKARQVRRSGPAQPRKLAGCYRDSGESHRGGSRLRLTAHRPEPPGERCGARFQRASSAGTLETCPTTYSRSLLALLQLLWTAAPRSGKNGGRDRRRRRGMEAAQPAGLASLVRPSARATTPAPHPPALLFAPRQTSTTLLPASNRIPKDRRFSPSPSSLEGADPTPSQGGRPCRRTDVGRHPAFGRRWRRWRPAKCRPPSSPATRSPRSSPSAARRTTTGWSSPPAAAG